MRTRTPIEEVTTGLEAWIRTRADPDGAVAFSISEAMGVTGGTKSAVRSALQRLIARGALVRETVGGGAATGVYRLAKPVSLVGVRAEQNVDSGAVLPVGADGTITHESASPARTGPVPVLGGGGGGDAGAPADDEPVLTVQDDGPSNVLSPWWARPDGADEELDEDLYGDGASGTSHDAAAREPARTGRGDGWGWWALLAGGVLIGTYVLTTWLARRTATAPGGRVVGGVNVTLPLRSEPAFDDWGWSLPDRPARPANPSEARTLQGRMI